MSELENGCNRCQYVWEESEICPMYGNPSTHKLLSDKRDLTKYRESYLEDKISGRTFVMSSEDIDAVLEAITRAIEAEKKLENIDYKNLHKKIAIVHESYKSRITELENALEEIVEVEEVTIPPDYVFNIARNALKGSDK